jgi:protein ImuA
MLSPRATLIQDLRTRIGSIEGGAKNSRRPHPISTGFEALDRLLPGGGLAAGTLLEWLGEGSFTLALAVAGAVVRSGGVLAIVGEPTFFPPAAAALGVPLERTVAIHPADERLKLWTWEQALRCEGIAATLGRMDRASDVVMRRLQLAVEAGGGLGFLVRPGASQGETCWAEARLLVKGAASTGRAWRLRVELLRCRGGSGGGAADVELNHETDDVPVVAELADSAGAE